MAANTKRVDVPNNTYGVRFPGWTNQVYNMPDEKVTPYNTTHLIIVDDDLSVDVAGDAAKVEHASCCNDIRDAFSQLVDNCTVHSIRMNDGQRARHFTQRIEQLLTQLNANDLVIFYFHGRAGGMGADYTWFFRGPGPNSINAYDLIALANRTKPDLWFILDCFVPSQPQRKWRREDRITEFSVTGAQKHDPHTGRRTNGRENFTAALCDSMRDVQARPRGHSRQTMHHVMGTSQVRVTDPLRIWEQRPVRCGKGSNKRVARICFDTETLRISGRYVFLSCEVTGRRTGEWGTDGGDGIDGHDGGNDEVGERHGGRGNDHGNDSDDDAADNGHRGMRFPHRVAGGPRFRRENHTRSRRGVGNRMSDQLEVSARDDQDPTVLNDGKAKRLMERLKKRYQHLMRQRHDDSLEQPRSRPLTQPSRSIKRSRSPFAGAVRPLQNSCRSSQQESSKLTGFKGKGKGKVPANASIGLTSEDEVIDLTQDEEQQEAGDQVTGDDHVQEHQTADAQSWWASGVWEPLKRSRSASPCPATNIAERPLKRLRTPAETKPLIDQIQRRREQLVSSDCEITDVRPVAGHRAKETVDLSADDNEE